MFGTSEEHIGEYASYDPLTDSYVGTTVRWTAKFRQSGPGVAESVRTAIRSPSGDWSEELPHPLLQIGRGAEDGIILCTGDKVPGEYVVRIRYRALPNTRKVREWKGKILLD